MATKNYMINDKWLDLDKQNIVELQSVDGVLDSLKVNGSEIETPSGKITITENGTDIDVAQYALADVNVEGGSSDFSTAVVQIIGSTPNVIDVFSGGTFVYIEDDELVAGGNYIDVGTYTVVLYKGSMVFITQVEPSSTTGAISEFTPVGKSVQATITGDCTMTFDELT